MTPKKAYLRFWSGVALVTALVGASYFFFAAVFIFIGPVLGVMLPSRAESKSTPFWPKSPRDRRFAIGILVCGIFLIGLAYSGVFNGVGVTTDGTLTLPAAAGTWVIFVAVEVFGLVMALKEPVATEVAATSEG